jgi:hypothetical protein
MAERKVRVLVGTRKGTYVVESDSARRKWKVNPVAHDGRDIFHAVADPRHPGTLYAAVNSSFWGPMIHRSRNWGKTWSEIATPLSARMKDRPDPMETAPNAPPRAVQAIWHLEPGHPSEPKTIFAGVDPHLLFRSDDEGDSWEPVPALNEHPTKGKWAPGAGGPAMHTIIVDPTDRRKMYVGISAAGTFKTEDAGAHWQAVNKGVEAGFLPEKFPEVGQCVHHVAIDAADPRLFYRQDHGGIYVSRDAMESWDHVGKALKFEDFGFAVASPAAAPGRAYFVPLKGEARVSPSGGLQVYQWTERPKGFKPLMDRTAFPGDLGVQREGLATDREEQPGIYVGTTTGQLILSNDAGKSWKQLPFAFPAIHSVSVA